MELEVETTLTTGMPAKIRALVNDLLVLPGTDKRYYTSGSKEYVLMTVNSIVFSFWTTTLDLVSIALTNAQITFTSLDGSMNAKHRQSALTSFINDLNIKVIMISLRYGANGLNLTVANHVFLMEPQWNPMVEDQALDRVHRIGQIKEVTTVRYIVENTLEEVCLGTQTHGEMQLAKMHIERS